MHYTDQLLLSYTGNAIKSTSALTLTTFTELAVLNELEPRWLVPGRVQAENYVAMNGFQEENCEDTGGGINLGYADFGDYAEYKLRIIEAKDYEVNFRVASQSSQGRVKLLLVTQEGETELGNYTFPSTGGWQTWTTSTHKITLPAGDHRLKLVVNSGNFNLNWFSFRDVILAADDFTQASSQIYPNPTQGIIYINDSSYKQFVLSDLLGRQLQFGKVVNNMVEISSKIGAGNYILTLVNLSGSVKHSQKVVLER
jgi:hypothetical protein